MIDAVTEGTFAELSVGEETSSAGEDDRPIGVENRRAPVAAEVFGR